MILGAHLTLLIGPTIAVPAPLPLTEALVGVEVTQNETGPSGFQLTFQVGRSGPLDLKDYNLLTNPLIRPFNRVCVVIRFNLTPTVLIDGFITQIQLTPSEQPGASTLTLTGEDVTVMMNLEEKTFPLAGTSEVVQVHGILNQYPLLGFGRRNVLPPEVPEPMSPNDSMKNQNATDYQHLTDLAAKHGYMFYVRPGPIPNSNIPYWGPAVPPTAMAEAAEHSALSVNMGPQTNVDSINFTYDAMALKSVRGVAVDPFFNIAWPIIFPPFSTNVPLAPIPGAIYQHMVTHVSRLDVQPEEVKGNPTDEQREKAQTPYSDIFARALADARAQVNDAANKTVTVTGELDALRYGGVLQARTIVGLRGAGHTYDGLYFVKTVNHSIKKGEYKQRFTMRREGVGPMSPLVRP
jgi:hypothetical protein